MSLSTRNGAKQRERDRYRILALLLADDTTSPTACATPRHRSCGAAQRADEIATMVNRLPAADIADAVESLPPDERHALWALVDPDRRGQVLVGHRKPCGTASSAA